MPRRESDDDDDFFDDDVPRRRRPRQSSSVRIVVGLIGGGVLLLIFSCCGLALWFIQSVRTEAPAAQAAAEAFLAELRQNRVEKALSATTPDYQRTMSALQFRAFVAAFPLFTQHTTHALSMRTIHLGTHGGHAVYGAVLTGPNGSLSCTLMLSKQGDQWKVQHLTVP